MKNALRIIGITVIALLAGFALASCDNGVGGRISIPELDTVNIVSSGKDPGAAVGAPESADVTSNSVTVSAVEAPGNGQTVEYGISTSNDASTVASWQEELTFSNLDPETDYYIFARSKEDNTHNAGTPSEGLSVTTDPSTGLEVITKSPGAVVKPTLNTNTAKSITVNPVTGNGQDFEYAISTSSTAPSAGWVQDKITFSGLNPETAYYIFTRSLENAAYYAGAPSAGLKVTTGQVGKLTITNIPNVITEVSITVGENVFKLGIGEDCDNGMVVNGTVVLDVYMREGGVSTHIQEDILIDGYGWILHHDFFTGVEGTVVTIRTDLQLDQDGCATIDFNDYFEINLVGMLVILNYPHDHGSFGAFSGISVVYSGAPGTWEQDATPTTNGILIYHLVVKADDSPFPGNYTVSVGEMGIYDQYHGNQWNYINILPIPIINGSAVVDFEEYFQMLIG